MLSWARKEAWMINGGPTIRFECIKLDDNRWQIVKLVVAREVAEHFGPEAFSPPESEQFYPPWGHLRRIATILSKEKLDGGSITEEYAGGRYVGVIEVKKRRPKFSG